MSVPFGGNQGRFGCTVSRSRIIRPAEALQALGDPLDASFALAYATGLEDRDAETNVRHSDRLEGHVHALERAREADLPRTARAWNRAVADVRVESGGR